MNKRLLIAVCMRNLAVVATVKPRDHARGDGDGHALQQAAAGEAQRDDAVAGLHARNPTPRVVSSFTPTSVGTPGPTAVKDHVSLHGPHTPTSSIARTRQKYFVPGVRSPGSDSVYRGFTDAAFQVCPSLTRDASIVRKLNL